MPAGLWNRVARQPQSLWLRKALFQVHLWTGIAVGLYVLVISLTGSVLVYRNELYRAFSPKPVIVDGSGQPISREAAEDAARSAYPGWDVSDVRTGETANHAIEVSLASGDRTKRRLLHPFTGEDLGDPLPAGYRLSAWLLDLHDNLLGGETGRRVNGVGAVLLILLCATGAVVWWPGVGRLRRSLLVSPRANWKRVTWSLHSALGFWFFAFVLIWGVSGAYLSFPQAFGALLDVLEPLDEANPVERVVDRIQVLAGVPALRPSGWPGHSRLRAGAVQLDDDAGLGDRRNGPRGDVRHRGADVVESRAPAAARRRARRGGSCRAGGDAACRSGADGPVRDVQGWALCFDRRWRPPYSCNPCLRSRGARMSTRHRPWMAAAMGLVFAHILFVGADPAVHTQAAQASKTVRRTPDGKPDFNGVWQALTTASWDLEDHNAQKGVPAGQGVVEGGASRTCRRRSQRRRNTRTSDGARPAAQVLPAGCSAHHVHAVSVPHQPDAELVTITYEYNHAYRWIWTDGSKHPEALDFWMGDSRGRWEGDTLVVDVANFNGQTWFDRAGNLHSDALHLVERYHAAWARPHPLRSRPSRIRRSSRGPGR